MADLKYINYDTIFRFLDSEDFCWICLLSIDYQDDWELHDLIPDGPIFFQFTEEMVLKLPNRYLKSEDLKEWWPRMVTREEWFDSVEYVGKASDFPNLHRVSHQDFWLNHITDRMIYHDANEEVYGQEASPLRYYTPKSQEILRAKGIMSETTKVLYPEEEIEKVNNSDLPHAEKMLRVSAILDGYQAALMKENGISLPEPKPKKPVGKPQFRYAEEVKIDTEKPGFIIGQWLCEEDWKYQVLMKDTNSLRVAWEKELLPNKS